MSLPSSKTRLSAGAALSRLRAQRADLEARVRDLETRAEALGNRGDMTGFVNRRKSVRIIQEHLDDVNKQIARLEEGNLPSRTYSQAVQR